MFSMKLTKTHGDFWATGTYDDATVCFTAHGARDLGSASRMFDFSENTYAGKSFYDSATDRQILFTWLGTPAYTTGMAGVQTLPREVLVDTDGVRIRTPPVAELQRLRRPPTSRERVCGQQRDPLAPRVRRWQPRDSREVVRPDSRRV